MTQVVLIDLDGVVRLFDPSATTAVEERHGLSPGTLVTAAFDEDTLARLVTGRLSKRGWLEQLGTLVGDAAAVREWAAQDVRVDREVVALAAELRATGTRPVVLTNGTDETRAEVDRLDVLDAFDGFLNSAEIGAAKPDPALFHRVGELLGAEPAQMLLVDDSAANVDGARAAGLSAHLHTDAGSLEAALRSDGLLR